MAGIVVIYDPLDNRERIKDSTKVMCEALWRSDREGPIEWYGDSTLGIGRCRPALINRAPQPAWNEERTIAVVFHGELFGCEELYRSLRKKGHSLSGTSHAEWVVHLYEEKGDAFVQELNGGFALALWDRPRQKLIVANDRYGLRPLYHARLGGVYLWASSPKAILANPAFHRQINLAAMADLLGLGIPQGNDTMFEGIDEALPGSLAVCQNGQVRYELYWDLTLQEEETGIPADDYLDELVSLLKQAAERRQPGELKTGLLLSGGFDSRVVLSVLDRKGLETFTFGTPHCDDVRFARQVTQAMNVRHVVLEIKPDYLETFAPIGIRRMDDLVNCDQFHGISVYDQIASRVHALITGSVGEDIFGQFVRDPQDEFWSTGFSADRYYDTKCIMADAELEQLLKPAYLRSLKGLARARFHRDFERYPSRHITHKLDYWCVRHQQRRLYTRLSSLFPDNLEFRPLYLDNDLIDFVQTVPPSMRWGEGSIYKQVLLREAPELARIPLTTTSGLPLDASHTQIVRHKKSRAHWRRWLSRARKLSAGLIPPLRNAKRYVDYDRWLRHELRSWAESILLDARTLDRDYWNPSAIVKMMQDHIQGQNLSGKLAALISLELWHRMYLDGVDATPFEQTLPECRSTGAIEARLDCASQFGRSQRGEEEDVQQA
jgi:asparagine synthase (glutamine-hydrolysing)